MKKTLRYGAIAIIVIILMCIFAGCVDRQTAPALASGETIPIRVITEEFPPYNYAGPDGAVTGQSTAVVQEIMRRTGVSYPIEILPLSEGLEAARTGPSTAIYSLAVTPERRDNFTWVGPIGTYTMTFFARNGSGIQVRNIDDIRSSGPVGVVQGDQRVEVLKENRVTDLSFCTNDTECLLRVAAGEEPLWLGSKEGLAYDLAKAGLAPDAVVPVYTLQQTELFIAFSRDTPANVTDGWQQALDSMYKDGTFHQIMDRWQTPASGISPPEVVGSADQDVILAAVTSLTDTTLEGVHSLLRALASTGDVRSGDPAKIVPVLKSVQADNPDILVWYSYPNGTYFTSNGLVSESLADRPYFPTLLSGTEVLGYPVTSRSTGRLSAVIAVPVTEGGAVTGIMGSSVYLDLLTEKIARALPLPPSLEFYALTPDGHYVIHSVEARILQDPALLGNRTSFGRAIQDILHGGNGTVAYDLEGTSWNATYGTSSFTGWKFVVAEPDPVTT
ncbi:ABC-type amino acid transport substrate-binding protein [Methanolinea mesophila]|uniref:transporter substrate-binding domain-containing protein n=1 Tax=Methanolinea mesophila TaxID=547055 RepID=UPI001AE5FF4F|nr:transporter substrate-binding domain-containing protein [Methanolinea mesophila]MBP1927617.1 ABC-type amino acid transport substrate-binding protein [Methanolinea mesophila]